MRKLLARQAGPWVAGFGQRLQPSFELPGIAVIEFACDGHQAGEVAQQVVRAGVGRHGVPKRLGPLQIAGVSFQTGGTQPSQGSVSLRASGGQLVKDSDLIRLGDAWLVGGALRSHEAAGSGGVLLPLITRPELPTGGGADDRHG